MTIDSLLSSLVEREKAERECDRDGGEKEGQFPVSDFDSSATTLRPLPHIVVQLIIISNETDRYPASLASVLSPASDSLPLFLTHRIPSPNDTIRLS